MENLSTKLQLKKIFQKYLIMEILSYSLGQSEVIRMMNTASKSSKEFMIKNYKVMMKMLKSDKVFKLTQEAWEHNINKCLRCSKIEVSIKKAEDIDLLRSFMMTRQEKVQLQKMIIDPLIKLDLSQVQSLVLQYKVRNLVIQQKQYIEYLEFQERLINCLQELNIEVNPSFFTQNPLAYPQCLMKISLKDFNFTRDFNLIVKLPKGLRELTFLTPQALELDFISVLLKYLSKLQRLNLLDLSKLTINEDDNEMVNFLDKLTNIIMTSKPKLIYLNPILIAREGYKIKEICPNRLSCLEKLVKVSEFLAEGPFELQMYYQNNMKTQEIVRLIESIVFHSLLIRANVILSFLTKATFYIGRFHTDQTSFKVERLQITKNTYYDQLGDSPFQIHILQLTACIGRKLKILDIYCPNIMMNESYKYISDLISIEEFRVQNVPEDQIDVLQLILEEMPQILRKLRLENVKNPLFKYTSIATLLQSHPNLEELTIMNRQFSLYLLRDSNFNINDLEASMCEFFQQLGQLTNLKRLEIYFEALYPNIIDDFTTQCLERLKDLVKLKVSGHYKEYSKHNLIEDKIFEVLEKGMPELKTFNVQLPLDKEKLDNAAKNRKKKLKIPYHKVRK